HISRRNAQDLSSGCRADADVPAPPRLLRSAARRGVLDLFAARGQHPQLARRLLKLSGRRLLLDGEEQSSLLVQQLLALAPQGLGLVAVLDGQNLLARGEDEAAREHETAREQDHLTARGARVSLAADVGVGVLLGHSSHLLSGLELPGKFLSLKDRE